MTTTRSFDGFATVILPRVCRPRESQRIADSTGDWQRRCFAAVMPGKTSSGMLVYIPSSTMIDSEWWL
jgi:hypothetical protein